MIRSRISAGRVVKGKTCWGGGAAMTVVGGEEGREKDKSLMDGLIL